MECNCKNEYIEGEDVTHLVGSRVRVTDQESLNRAVEEALAEVYRCLFDDTGGALEHECLVTLIAAVDARARAEERERYEHDLSTTWKDLALESQRQVQELLARARSSEEVGE